MIHYAAMICLKIPSVNNSMTPYQLQKSFSMCCSGQRSKDGNKKRVGRKR